MEGMYAVPNFLNGPPDYLEKIQEFRYSEQPLKTYKSLFEEYIHYCHKGEDTILNKFLRCGMVLQRTYSKTGLIYALSSICRSTKAAKPLKFTRMYKKRVFKKNESILDIVSKLQNKYKYPKVRLYSNIEVDSIT